MLLMKKTAWAKAQRQKNSVLLQSKQFSLSDLPGFEEK